MRKIHIPLLCFITFLFLLFSGCSKDEARKQFQKITLYKPIYKSKASLLADINGSTSEPVENGGKIYVKDHYIFLNDVDKGIHILDNSNPAKPVQVGFLNIPGNQDIAVKGNTLFADMYSDLVSIDISNPKHALVNSITSNVFTGRMYEYGTYFYDTTQVVVGWITKDTLVEAYNYPIDDCRACMFENAASYNKASYSATGVAGSMAKMIIINNNIYAITEPHSLGIIDITNTAKPVIDSSFFAGFDLETIYPFEGKLFLGSQTGMFMYDVSNPSMPIALGQFEHGRACDPVISDGDYAYVTLRTGTNCGGDENELDVIDIKNLQQPQLVKSYALTKPTGLSKDGNLLFICDGSDVKIFDVAKPADAKLLQQLQLNEPYDVILQNNIALVVAKSGLYQLDYSNLNNVKRLSYIPVKF